MPRKARHNKKYYYLLATIAILAIAGGYFLENREQGPLVVYCAHDAEYAEPLLRRFEQATGIPLAIRFDTEATKSLGLVEQIIREKDNPRCDVFWNNQEIGTQRLKEAGALESFKGSGYARIPDAFKDPDGFWTGFGARLRVYIVNTEMMPATEEAVAEKLAGDLSRVAVAKPLYGTTFVHYCAIRQLEGEEALKSMHADWRARNVVETTGNAQCKNLVASGTCDMGWTDTDDFFVAKDEGKPVEMLPIRILGGRTICCPNTVAIVKGTKSIDRAQRLVEFLLSEGSEIELANSQARQIPLGPVDETKIPPEVAQLKLWAADACSLHDIMKSAPECLAWLKAIYIQ